MTNIVITAEVEDLQQWESGFRTHADLFRRQTVSGSIDICMQDGNKVALIFQVTDVSTFMNILDKEGPGAMANDGVKRETVNIYVMDKQMEL